MQRQSLGSPAGKHLPPPIHVAEDDDDADGKKKRKKKAGGGAAGAEIDDDGEDDEVKPERPIRRSSGGTVAASASSATGSVERSIHLIPVLTFLCFLVLYLCSHDPSATDMTDLGSAGRLLDHTASRAEIGRYSAGSGGGVAAAVRGHRSLKELERTRRGGGGGSRKLGRRTA
uniref:Testis-and ovary-specific PAZ domain-containing protein 1 n=1 Tax=Anthurium amnicola TaxID=1678845 RepID=A0A1D1ZLF2_9ARAE